MSSNEQVAKTRLGDILLDKGLINQIQLEEAISVQKECGKQLGQILIDNGWVTNRQINQALKVQSKLRNALVTSLIGLSPLAMVGCGSGGGGAMAAPPAASAEVQQVENSGQEQLEQGGSSGQQEQSAPDSGSVGSGGSSSGDSNPVENGSSGSGSLNGGSSGDANVVESNDPGNEQVTEEAPSETVGSGNSGSESPVEQPPVTLGAVEFNWQYPQFREDGSDFEVYEIDGFKIYQVSENGDAVHDVSGNDTNFIVTELASGDYQFAITVIDTDGQESELSQSISITI